MSGLRSGSAGPQSRCDEARMSWATVTPPDDEIAPEPDGDQESGMVELHESIAALLASRGQWQQAYRHLRSAVDLMSSDEPTHVPRQLRHEVDRLRREHAEAYEQSRRDSLTGSYNRRYLDERLEELAPGGSRDGLGIALVDLDWFKEVNDTYGHVLGDRVLRQVVELIQEVLPGGGFCARYGGEEFVLVLPGVGMTTALAACEAARARVESFTWLRMAPGLHVTVSVGLGYQRRATETVRPGSEQLILNADMLLYAAKRSGRNAVAYRSGGEVRLAGRPGQRNVLGASRDHGH
ncbi:diguanylate cyclase (GGDEF)-like protein [Saccharopolyspora lacisalsi]|uniref:Diguanylate cyclase (GGDEF)-like protein n=1 Tax=Halosaccharopolyspora lacisalsi TaxID=1000566 RepID=A0A839E7K0_9PSEU|nr:GGDEF domain-containing protein [Halosaccharopolyspora lacisalsi]MBA8827251.1 diguanylate cyclase (GGDEF)-like protein [Halosaccharopolyspora lacisalsi]